MCWLMVLSGMARAQTVIATQNFDAVTAPALPTNMTFGSGYVTTASFTGGSAPNCLSYNLTLGTQSPVYFNAQDGNSGNASLGGTWFVTGSGTQYAVMTLRTQANPSNPTTRTGYQLNMLTGPAFNCIQLNRQNAGTGSNLLFQGTGLFANGVAYKSLFTANGAVLTLQIQRLSDSNYLVGTTWQAGAGNVFSVTDTSPLPQTQGYAGVEWYTASGVSGAYWDNLTFTALSPAGLTAGAITANATTLTSITPQLGTISGGTAPYSTVFFYSTTSGGSYTPIGTAVTGATPVANAAATGLTSNTTYYFKTVTTDSTAGTPLTLTTPSSGGTGLMISSRSAGTYYVSGTAAGGGNGTSSVTPFTLAEANAFSWVAGDTILFDAANACSGSFQPALVTGSASLITTISSYGTGRATINCANGVGLKLQNVGYVNVSNLIIAGAGVSNLGSTTSTQPAIEVVSTGSAGGFLSHIYLDNLDVSGCQKGIYIHSSQDTTPTNYNDVRVTNTKIHECGWFGIRTEKGTLNGNGAGPQHTNFYVGGCEVYNIYGLTAVTFPETGDGITLVNVNHGRVERCYVHDCGLRNAATVGGPVGCWTFESSDVVIAHCYVINEQDGSHVDGAGFDLDGGAQSCIIEYCTAVGCYGGGFNTGTYAAGTFNGTSYPASTATQNNVFRFCVSENNGAARAGAWHDFGTMTNNIVHNCTFYGSIMLQRDGTTGASTFYNNVFYVTSGGSFGAYGTGYSFFGNDYYFASGTFSIAGYASLGAWRTGTSNELVNGVFYGLASNPLFTNAGGAQAAYVGSTTLIKGIAGLTAYDVSNSSPLLDIGLDLKTLYGITLPTYDFRSGLTRPRNNNSVGASTYPVGGYTTTTSIRPIKGGPVHK